MTAVVHKKSIIKVRPTMDWAYLVKTLCLVTVAAPSLRKLGCRVDTVHEHT